MTATSPPAQAHASYVARTADATAEAVANMAALADLAEAEADTGEAEADGVAGTEVGDDVAMVGEERGA